MKSGFRAGAMIAINVYIALFDLRKFLAFSHFYKVCDR